VPTFEGRLTEDGATVELFVGVSHARCDMLQKHGLPVPAPVKLLAQVDPGAYCTAVDGTIFASLEIGPTDTKEVRTPSPTGGATIFDLYAVSLSLDGGAPRPLMEVMSCYFLDDERIRALIGRDMLQSCCFIYDGRSGKFSLSY
jgi:hypothetical protein